MMSLNLKLQIVKAEWEKHHEIELNGQILEVVKGFSYIVIEYFYQLHYHHSFSISPIVCRK